MINRIKPKVVVISTIRMEWETIKVFQNFLEGFNLGLNMIDFTTISEFSHSRNCLTEKPFKKSNLSVDKEIGYVTGSNFCRICGAFFPVTIGRTVEFVRVGREDLELFIFIGEDDVRL